MFDTLTGAESVNAVPVLVLDGGLGTTLEDSFHVNISTPLWSAKPIDKDPEVIINAHLAFLHSGARLISTATYQCAYDTFEREGYSRTDAVNIMRKAVRLAQAAKSRHLIEHPFVQAENIKILLSLGPYGATQSTHEFDGIYPPPYGPRAYDPSKPGETTNHFESKEDEEKALEALREFHLERLRVFAEDKETWDDIDCIAFETVPLRREIRAIRRAMAELARDGKRKSWWISTVHPDGRFPEHTGCADERVRMQDIVNALLDDDGLVPDGVGVNCSPLGHIPELLRDMAYYTQQQFSAHDPKRWLVVYPNGVCEHSTNGWSSGSSSLPEDSQREAWAKRLWEAVEPALQSSVWRGLVLGGCCKTGPLEIAALSREVARAR